MGAMKRIIVVTGASSGLGWWFAKLLAQESADHPDISSDALWLIARRKERLLQLQEEIEREGRDTGQRYPQVRVFSMDLAGSAGAARVKELLEREAAGGIEVSVLVNNAGFGTYGEFARTDTLRQMQMVDLDCTALTGITGFALPYMGRGSRIINVASLAAFLPLGNFAVYSACKSYVLYFTVALAAELEPRGIKVSALCPGPVDTEFAAVASNGARAKVKHGRSAKKTVEHALAASRRGRLYSMRFLWWKVQAVVSRFVPRRLGAWVTFKFCKRPSN